MYQLKEYRLFTLFAKCRLEVFCFSLYLVLGGCHSFAQNNDTIPLRKKNQSDSIKSYELKGVTISDIQEKPISLSLAPLQKLSSSELETQGALQLSDAVKQFSGTIIKDYGGIGGLKTISVRSLGSQNTLVAYDGITLSDCQNGQVDLGKFTLENVAYISLVNGQDDNILQTARAFSLSSLLNIQSKTPVFEQQKPFNLLIGAKAGSFGLFNPLLIIENRISNKVSLSFNVNWLQSTGDYPFTIRYGSKNDSVSSETRQNSDIKSLSLEANAFIQLTPKQKLNVKANYYDSERGLPGAVVFYTSNSLQRLWDRNFFIQANYANTLSQKFLFRVDAKYSNVYTHYLDPYYLLNADKKLDEEFRQNEYYLSEAIQYNIFKPFSISWANDFFVNRLHSNLNKYNEPERYSWLSALNAKYDIKRLQILASLLSTQINEHTNQDHTEKQYHQLTPFAGVTYKIFKKENLRLRYFYKQNYRVPNFNELYYNNIGNPDLRPEKTNQQNVGITYSASFGSFAPLVLFTADGYYNNVNDKIIAVPRQNLFVWSMQNIGKVQSTGIDIVLESHFQLYAEMKLIASGNYGYQQSLDKSNSKQKTYDNQIPYTPVHSGNLNISFLNPWVDFNYNIFFCGTRYTGVNTKTNELEAYTEHNVTLSKQLKIKRVLVKLQAQVLNLFDTEYEVVNYYPMPGRNYRIGITASY